MSSNIEESAFKGKKLNGITRKPLMVGCSGGGGHNTAIEGVANYLESDKYSEDVDCIDYKSTLYIPKVKHDLAIEPEYHEYILYQLVNKQHVLASDILAQKQVISYDRFQDDKSSDQKNYKDFSEFKNKLADESNPKKDNVIKFKELLTKFPPEEFYSLQYNKVDSAYGIFNTPLIGTLVKQTTKAIGLPSFPDKSDIIQEIKNLDNKNYNKNGVKKRKYIDMLLDVYIEKDKKENDNHAGYVSAAIWNVLQRQGKTKDLKKLIQLQPHSDKEYHQTVKKDFFKRLQEAAENKKPYTEIISTQAMALPGLCDAVIEYNKWLEKEQKRGIYPNYPSVEVHQYMTDLPTKGAVHFFPALNSLSAKQAKVMKLYAVNLEQKVIDQELSNHKDFEGLYKIDPTNNPMVRPGFNDEKNYSTRDKIENDKLLIKDIKGTTTELSINKKDKVISIMLGSQGGSDEDVIAILMNFIDSGYHKVILCGVKDTNALQNKINQNIKVSDKISVIGYLDDHNIAKVMTVGDVYTRTGGLSVMEQMAMNQKIADKKIMTERNIFLHHPDTDGPITSGIEWEDGNADELSLFCRKLGFNVQKTMPKRIEDDCKISEIIQSIIKKLSDEKIKFKDSNYLTANPALFAYLALAYDNRIKFDGNEKQLFTSLENWYACLKEVYAKKDVLTSEHGRQFWANLINATYFYGLQSHTLTDIQQHLEKEGDIRCQQKLLGYLTQTDSKSIGQERKKEDLEGIFNKQIVLYKEKKEDPYKSLCQGFQNLIRNSYWQAGILNRKTVKFDDDGKKSCNKIPRSMEKILKIINTAKTNDGQEEGNEHWQQAIKDIQKYINDYSLDKSKLFTFKNTTKTYQFFKQQIEECNKEQNNQLVI